MTYNIWNYASSWKRRMPLICGVIRDVHPDVVALQETRHDFRHERGRGQGEQLAAATGYHATSETAQVYVPVARVDEGLTILTHEPAARVRISHLTLLGAERADENHRICLGVTIDSGSKRLHVFNTHFSLSAAARESNAREVADFVAREAGDEPAVLAGDLNAEPGEASIRYLTGAETRDGVTGDFIDCWQAVHGVEPGYTYASWDSVRRIDYVLGRNLSAVPRRAWVVGNVPTDDAYPSDHLGLVVDLE
ncbi:MAG: endonuclease/exonuclease/phosphatase family protein [Chloroflexota bacterium]